MVEMDVRILISRSAFSHQNRFFKVRFEELYIQNRLLEKPMHARRALLYVPGNDRHKIEKALTLGVDCICLDLEDGVAATRKLEARSTIVTALQELDFGSAEKLVRINPVGSGHEADELSAVLPAHPDGIVIPKVEHARQVAWISGQIESAELSHGWPLNSIRLVVDVETARGILNLDEIAAQPRLDAIIFGAEDFAASIGATRTPGAWEVFHARSAVVLAAAAYGLQAIDMVTIDFKDIDKLRHEAEFGAQLGYNGKQVIHPNQVAPVQQAFTPGPEAVAHAQRIIDSFEASLKEGKGAYALDGDKMIDMPLVKAARAVLVRAGVPLKDS
jgi:citrate lyase beta subunit